MNPSRITLTCLVLVGLLVCSLLLLHYARSQPDLAESEEERNHLSESETEPPSSPGTEVSSPADSAQKPKGPSSWARVYIDSSGSMKGFIKQQPYRRLIKRLKDSLVFSQVLNFEAARFGLTVHKPVRVSAFQRIGFEENAYKEGDTYLAGVIENALAWDKKGVIVVLTDGVASLTRYQGTQESQSARSCDRGSDTACLALRLREYIQSGYNFWVVGFRFPFEGDYWVEEGGLAANRGKRLDINVPDRPFYVWIGGPHVRQGRLIVSHLIQLVAQEADPPIPFMAIEVAPGKRERWSVHSDAGLEEVSLSAPPKNFCPRGEVLLEKFKPRAEGQQFSVLEVVTRKKMRTEERVLYGVRLPLQQDIEGPGGMGTEDIVPLLNFRQELQLLPNRGPWSFKKKRWTYEEALEEPRDDRWQLLDLCIGGNPSELQGKTVKVKACWKSERAVSMEAFPWDDWSTDLDDTPEAASRTVNLSMFFYHLLNQLKPEIGGEPGIAPPCEILIQITYQ